MKLLLYCTKAKPILYNVLGKFITTKYMGKDFKQDGLTHPELNGKIVAECDFEVEEIFEDNLEDARDGYVEHFYTLKSYDDFDEGENVLLKESCLQKHELSNYLGFENGYAIHIKNLQIFDKPRDIRNYYNIAVRTMADCMNQRNLRKPPQNMCNAYNVYKNHYILISIKPEWLCKILNGEKTIEVRKKVLKEMLE